ncbi:MAG: GDCCVxC domain-containing (seleno)protein [Caulobacteraceae bacterium]
MEASPAAAPITVSLLTCPHCGARTEETMPLEACLWRWKCPECAAEITPLAGRCCVFCSYGSVPCPPVQLYGVCP